MRALIGRLWLRVFGWTLVGEAPATGKFVFIAAPHTSNWDLPFMLATAWTWHLRISWMGKHTLFEGPFGWALKLLGGLPIDRRAPGGMVKQVVGLFETRDHLILAIPPEGTRGRRDHWKSGFYHIAHGAKVPLGTGFLDYANKRCGLGPLIELTGEVGPDMDRVRAFYEPLQGKFPAKQGRVRLREEDAPAAEVS